MEIGSVINQYILIHAFMIVCNVIMVSAIDKTLTPMFPDLNKHRGWVLPIVSLFCGVILYQLFSSAEGIMSSYRHIAFSGLNIGAFSTVFYKIVREGIQKRIQERFNK